MGARSLTADERNSIRNISLLRISSKKSDQKVTFEDFKILMVLGRGAFGKVFLAELKSDKSLYAVKAIRKDILIELD